MGELERLVDVARELAPAKLAEVIRFAERQRAEDPELDTEAEAWMDGELAPDLDPYDWGPDGPPRAKPVLYEPGVGFVIVGGRDG